MPLFYQLLSMEFNIPTSSYLQETFFILQTNDSLSSHTIILNSKFNSYKENKSLMIFQANLKFFISIFWQEESPLKNLFSSFFPFILLKITFRLSSRVWSKKSENQGHILALKFTRRACKLNRIDFINFNFHFFLTFEA